MPQASHEISIAEVRQQMLKELENLRINSLNPISVTAGGLPVGVHMTGGGGGGGGPDRRNPAVSTIRTGTGHLLDPNFKNPVQSSSLDRKKGPCYDIKQIFNTTDYSADIYILRQVSPIKDVALIGNFTSMKHCLAAIKIADHDARITFEHADGHKEAFFMKDIE